MLDRIEAFLPPKGHGGASGGGLSASVARIARSRAASDGPCARPRASRRGTRTRWPAPAQTALAAARAARRKARRGRKRSASAAVPAPLARGRSGGASKRPRSAANATWPTAMAPPAPARYRASFRQRHAVARAVSALRGRTRPPSSARLRGSASTSARSTRPPPATPAPLWAPRPCFAGREAGAGPSGRGRAAGQSAGVQGAQRCQGAQRKTPHDARRGERKRVRRGRNGGAPARPAGRPDVHALAHAPAISLAWVPAAREGRLTLRAMLERGTWTADGRRRGELRAALGRGLGPARRRPMARQSRGQDAAWTHRRLAGGGRPEPRCTGPRGTDGCRAWSTCSRGPRCDARRGGARLRRPPGTERRPSTWPPTAGTSMLRHLLDAAAGTTVDRAATATRDADPEGMQTTRVAAPHPAFGPAQEASRRSAPRGHSECGDWGAPLLQTNAFACNAAHFARSAAPKSARSGWWRRWPVDGARGARARSARLFGAVQSEVTRRCDGQRPRGGRAWMASFPARSARCEDRGGQSGGRGARGRGRRPTGRHWRGGDSPHGDGASRARRGPERMGRVVRRRASTSTTAQPGP